MAENIENNGCSQRDNAEHEGYVKASRSFNRIWKERDSAQPRLLEAILYKDNFNRAYKRVKANKGAPGIDGMTIEEALPYLKEHQQEITDRIYRGKYTPSPVRRVEIPKPDGGVRKLGIPTVIDRTLQQAITQQLVPIYEPLFAEGSYGYRPNRSAKDAILKVKEYAEQGFALGRNGKGIYVRVHPKSWKKFKSRLKELSSRKRCQSIKPSLEKIKVYARGWLNYYGMEDHVKEL